MGWGEVVGDVVAGYSNRQGSNYKCEGLTMAEVCGYSSKMRSNDKDDLRKKCRERRRRRLEMRRLGISAAASSSSSSSSSGSVEDSSSGEEATTKVADFLTPVVGAMSVAGRLREMEDAITVRTNLCMPEINRNQPVHFFGVFDGHGGPHVAALCRAWMHVIFEKEVMRVGNITTPRASAASSSNRRRQLKKEKMQKEIEEAWRRVVTTCFLRMDELATADSCRCYCKEEKCGCQPNEVALSGATAVVVILTQEYIIVANCGDSRAVLCRGGRSVPLSVDHKPDRADERARIEASGGRVIFNNGARVQGILAMSRAIGDKHLKPLVIAEPEIFFRRRSQEDECLILASDGLWDVLSNNMAGQVARECLREEWSAAGGTNTSCLSPSFPTRSAAAAALLTRLALGRKSFDNISVIVVDLKRIQMSG